MIFDLSEGMENCKMSGKNQGKSGNFEMDDKWQPCLMKTGLMIANEGHYLIIFIKSSNSSISY